MKVLIINTPGLQTGGVENFIHSLILYCLSQAYRVVWVTTKKAFQKAVYRDVADNNNVEKVFYKNSSLKTIKKFPDIKLNHDDMNAMVSFTPEFFLFGEQLKNRKLKKNIFINHFFVMMNFFGQNTFLEKMFENPKQRNRYFPYVKQLMLNIAKNNSLLAFSIKHLQAFEENYGIELPNKNELVLPSIFPLEEPTNNYLLEKATYRSVFFDIIVCSRFEFPHKGFVIGVLNEAERIFNLDKHIRLTVVGHGGDKETNMVKQNVSKLKESFGERIRLLPQQSPDELTDLFRKSSLVIGLAGTASLAAKTATPVLVMRHNSYEAETYGLFSESETTLSDVKGKEVLPFIKTLLSLNEFEYSRICLQEFCCISKKIVVNPEFIFFKCKTIPQQTTTTKMISTGKRLILNAKILHFFKRFE